METENPAKTLRVTRISATGQDGNNYEMEVTVTIDRRGSYDRRSDVVQIGRATLHINAWMDVNERTNIKELQGTVGAIRFIIDNMESLQKYALAFHKMYTEEGGRNEQDR